MDRDRLYESPRDLVSRYLGTQTRVSYISSLQGARLSAKQAYVSMYVYTYVRMYLCKWVALCHTIMHVTFDTLARRETLDRV